MPIWLNLQTQILEGGFAPCDSSPQIGKIWGHSLTFYPSLDLISWVFGGRDGIP